MTEICSPVLERIKAASSAADVYGSFLRKGREEAERVLSSAMSSLVGTGGVPLFQHDQVIFMNWQDLKIDDLRTPPTASFRIMLMAARSVFAHDVVLDVRAMVPENVLAMEVMLS